MVSLSYDQDLHYFWGKFLHLGNHLIFNHFWYLWYVLYCKQVDSNDNKMWAPFILSMVLTYLSNSNPAFNKKFLGCQNVKATTSPLSVPKNDT